MRAWNKIKSLFVRPPDFYIGGIENPYIRRWYLFPRNKLFNIYLHHMLRDDDDRALHDHPWFNISIILSGGYIEIVPIAPKLYPDDYRTIEKYRNPGNIIFRRPSSPHRLELFRNGFYQGGWRAATYSWSIMIIGPRVREWGFWCPGSTGYRWVHWKDFTDPTDTGKTGKGCA